VAALLQADRSSSAALADQFMANLPRLEKHARYALRHIPCPDAQADLIAETVALAWKLFLSLVRRGKDPTTFFTTVALRCSQAVRSGRRLAGSDASKDVMSPLARKRHGFTVGGLDDRPRKDDALAEALAENTQSEVPDQAAFRIDFPRWRRGFGGRKEQVLDALMVGEGTRQVAECFGLSQARVSQMRREFQDNWDEFHAGHDERRVMEHASA
jgi:hypothetical protein